MMGLDGGWMVQGPVLPVKGWFYSWGNGKTLNTYMEETDIVCLCYRNITLATWRIDGAAAA